MLWYDMVWYGAQGQTTDQGGAQLECVRIEQAPHPNQRCKATPVAQDPHGDSHGVAVGSDSAYDFVYESDQEGIDNIYEEYKSDQEGIYEVAGTGQRGAYHLATTSAPCRPSIV